MQGVSNWLIGCCSLMAEEENCVEIGAIASRSWTIEEDHRSFMPFKLHYSS